MLGIKQVGSIQRTLYMFDGIAAPLETTTLVDANTASGMTLDAISVEQGVFKPISTVIFVIEPPTEFNGTQRV